MAELIEHDDLGLLRALPAMRRNAERYCALRAALLSGGPEWQKLVALLNIAPDTPDGVDDAVDAALSALGGKAGDGGGEGEKNAA